MPVSPWQRELFPRRGTAVQHTRMYSPPPGEAWRRALGRRRLGFAIVFVLCVALGVALFWCRTPEFEASTTVEVAPAVAWVNWDARAAPAPPPDTAAVQTTASALASRAVVAAALGRMGPQAAALLQPPIRHPRWLARHWPRPASRLEAVRRHLHILTAADSRMVVLQCVAPDPSAAADFLRQWLAAFELSRDAARQALSANRVRFLQQQADQARSGVAASAADMEAVAREEGLTDPATQLRIATARWQQLAASQTEAQVGALQASDALARHAPLTSTPGAPATTVIPPDLSVQRALVAAQVERLAEQYQPQALPLRQARQQLAALDADIARLHTLQQRRRQRALAAVHQQVRDLGAAIQRQQQTQQRLQAAMQRFDLAQAQFTAGRRTYAGLLEQLRQAIASGGVASPAVLVRDPARVPVRRFRPRWAPSLASIALLGLVAALAFVWISDRRDDRLRWPEAGELGVPLAAVVPWRRSAAAAPATARGVERCAVSLLLAQHETGLRVVHITSTEPREGKTTLAVALAECLAQQQQRVLLLDANLAQPALHAIYAGTLAPGLVELFASQAEVDQVLRQSSAHPLLHYIAAGEGGAGACLALAAGAGADLLAAARARFDWILLDGPSVTAGPEAGLWSSLAGCTLMLARCGQTSRAGLRRGLDALESAGASSLGLVILDQHNPSRAADLDLWRPQAESAAEPVAMRQRA